MRLSLPKARSSQLLDEPRQNSVGLVDDPGIEEIAGDRQRDQTVDYDARDAALADEVFRDVEDLRRDVHRCLGSGDEVEAADVQEDDVKLKVELAHVEDPLGDLNERTN